MEKSHLLEVRPAAEQSGWNFQYQAKRLEKDGYEIYFFDDGRFELTMRDPETTERVTVYEYNENNVHSPLYVAIIIYIVENVERVALDKNGKDN